MTPAEKKRLLDDDGITLKNPEFDDVWTAWNWENVSCFVPVKDILPAV